MDQVKQSAIAENYIKRTWLKAVRPHIGPLITGKRYAETRLPRRLFSGSGRACVIPTPEYVQQLKGCVPVLARYHNAASGTLASTRMQGW
jgi:hypothetical protein